MILKSLFTLGELVRLGPGCQVKVKYNTLYSLWLNLFKMRVLLKVYFVLSHVHCKASFLVNKFSFLNFSTIKEVSYSIEMTILVF